MAVWSMFGSCERGGWVGKMGRCAVVVLGTESAGCVGWVLLERQERWARSWCGIFHDYTKSEEVENLSIPHVEVKRKLSECSETHLVI